MKMNTVEEINFSSMWFDENYDLMSFEVKQVVSSALKDVPHWIEVDLVGKKIKIKPLFTNIGTYKIQIIAKDPYHG